MTKLVTSYVNPDLDGVAAAYLLADLSGAEWRPGFLGQVDAETRVVFEWLGAPYPRCAESYPADLSALKLVDSHNPEHFPATLPRELVVEIVDHHSDGRPGAFPNAVTENDLVGASVTLLVERYERQHRRLDSTLARLALAAIWSNTQELGGPATTQRDRSAVEKLARQFGQLSDALVVAMRRARSAVLALSAREMLLADSKSFIFGGVRVSVAQVEAAGAESRAGGDDVRRVLSTDYLKETGADVGIASFVDTTAGTTTVIASDGAVERALADQLGGAMRGNGVALDRVCLRKTDLVPALLEVYANR